MGLEALELVLFLLATVLLSSVVTQLVPRVSAPLVQIVLGVAVALLAPGHMEITLDPELFMVLFIAPLLYDEAKNADKAALWRYRGPALSLAIGLVLVTIIILGFSVHAVLPLIPLAGAFALCAALSPTDPIAVASLSDTAEIPKRSAKARRALPLSAPRALISMLSGMDEVIARPPKASSRCHTSRRRAGVGR